MCRHVMDMGGVAMPVCVVCLQPVDAREANGCDECGALHAHAACLVEWWRHGVGCPLCRHCPYAQYVSAYTDAKLQSTHEYACVFFVVSALLPPPPPRPAASVIEAQN